MWGGFIQCALISLAKSGRSWSRFCPRKAAAPHGWMTAGRGPSAIRQRAANQGARRHSPGIQRPKSGWRGYVGLAGPGYGHYRADYSKELVIRKSRSFKRWARKRACFHQRDRGFPGNRQGFRGTAGAGPVKFKGTPKHAFRPRLHIHLKETGRRYDNRPSDKAGALLGCFGVGPPWKNPSQLGMI